MHDLPDDPTLRTAAVQEIQHTAAEDAHILMANNLVPLKTIAAQEWSRKLTSSLPRTATLPHH